MGIYLNPGTEKFEEAIRSEIFIQLVIGERKKLILLQTR